MMIPFDSGGLAMAQIRLDSWRLGLTLFLHVAHGRLKGVFCDGYA